MDLDAAAQAFREFAEVVQALRAPETGCPWDLEQDHLTLRPYLIEEAYEVLEAIDHGNDRAFCEELGDLLLQVVLHAQVAADRGAFSITDVIRSIIAKMVRRHPHVFGTVKVNDSEEVRRNWEQIKASEGRDKDGSASVTGAFAELPAGLPALLRAQRLGEKAARVHFDWDSLAAVVARMRDDFADLNEYLCTPAVRPTAEAQPNRPGDVRGPMARELGDLLFTLCQLARWLDIGAEDSLRDSSRRFVERWRRLEQQAPRPLVELSRVEVEAAWRRTKDTPSPTEADPASEQNPPV
jgi:MazG family protein